MKVPGPVWLAWSTQVSRVRGRRGRDGPARRVPVARDEGAGGRHAHDDRDRGAGLDVDRAGRAVERRCRVDGRRRRDVRPDERSAAARRRGAARAAPRRCRDRRPPAPGRAGRCRSPTRVPTSAADRPSRPTITPFEAPGSIARSSAAAAGDLGRGGGRAGHRRRAAARLQRLDARPRAPPRNVSAPWFESASSWSDWFVFETPMTPRSPAG